MTDLFQKQEDLPQIDNNKNYLTELVGDGKKFKSPEELARGKYEADQYIEVLKQRMDELRENYLKVSAENKSQADLKTLIDQMQQERLANSNNTPANEDGIKPLKTEELEALFDQRYQKQRSMEKQNENLTQVQNKLKETWGENYSRLLKQKTEELDLSEQEVLSMAKTNPKLLYRTFGLDSQQRDRNLFDAPPRSQQRSDSFAPTGPKARTWQYYQDLKKANPNLYFDRKTAVQMMKDAETLGKDFHDGNYFVPGMHDE